jgi:hypothetical protein
MFGSNDQQAQASNPSNGGFSPANFTPPAANTNADASSTPVNPLTTPELPATGTPDPVPTSDSTPVNASPSASSDDELLDLKQQALQQLSPLVGQLDQTPEEKFRTTMMMIQASDDQSLLKAAYDAAQAISNEKERAQALLDVINEINYFTQHGQPQ